MAIIDGLNDLINKLNDLSIELPDKIIDKALNNASKIVYDAAMENIYDKEIDDTGELKRSVNYKVKNNEGIIGANKPYAAYVELGTGLFAVKGNGRTDVPWYFPVDDEYLAKHPSAAKMKIVYGKNGQKFIETAGQHPQPFLGPALTENKNNIRATFIQHINSFLRGLCK